jgi:phosphatidylglycerol---prolipoprotein diacylglyceryl transferase
VYADFLEIFNRLFGISWPWLSLLKTFGFFMALSFFAAGYILYLELKRKELNNNLQSTYKTIEIGKKVAPLTYLIQAVLGAIIGYKIIGMIQHVSTAAPDPIAYLSTTKGSIMGAIIGAIVSVLMRYQTYREQANNGVLETKKFRIPPYQRVGDIALVAAVAGFLGAKIFNALEDWNNFITDPINNLISSSGFTFYGGLILATIALYFYSKKININFKHLCDTAAPALIFAYGLGRIGCQISGDGDWGIFNSAYANDANGVAVLATDSNNFNIASTTHKSYFDNHFAEYKAVPNKAFARPAALSFLPHSFFAYSYPHNVNKTGIPLQNCTNSSYCTVLPAPVYPTPVYEFIMCTLIFLVLWYFRKKFTKPLDLFALYLILNGIERYTIEQIRVNYKYNFNFWHPTQAELIALALIIVGIGLAIYNRVKVTPNTNQTLA